MPAPAVRMDECEEKTKFCVQGFGLLTDSSLEFRGEVLATSSEEVRVRLPQGPPAFLLTSLLGSQLCSIGNMDDGEVNPGEKLGRIVCIERRGDSEPCECVLILRPNGEESRSGAPQARFAGSLGMFSALNPFGV